MNTIENVTLAMLGRGKYVMNLVFKVTKTITGGKLWVTLNKCKTTSVGDCEYVLTYHLEYCSMLSAKGPWSGFLEASRPRFKCPMKPGNYMIRNASLDASQIMNIGSVAPARWWDDYHWRVKFELIDKKQSLGCGIITMSYQRIRLN
ncbi:unnamed protein product [Nezara viridula]|uniref:MD-2-related lipid-recognition domain-containing protein n=1 Tax=Nezara viridula TaxID=85310 RepID=A0A9P0H5N8_NEZVI|nr:unnamed protein product [Nezara viridula]